MYVSIIGVCSETKSSFNEIPVTSNERKFGNLTLYLSERLIVIMRPFRQLHRSPVCKSVLLTYTFLDSATSPSIVQSNSARNIQSDKQPASLAEFHLDGSSELSSHQKSTLSDITIQKYLNAYLPSSGEQVGYVRNKQ